MSVPDSTLLHEHRSIGGNAHENQSLSLPTPLPDYLRYIRYTLHNLTHIPN